MGELPDSSTGGCSDRLHKAQELCTQLGQGYSDGGVLMWSVLQAGLRATHTLVLTYWQALLAGIEKDEVANGAVYAGAYLLAAMAVCVPAFPWVDAGARGRWPVIMAVGSAASAATLLCMSLSGSRLLAAVLFVLFHASAEALLMVAAVSIGRSLNRVERQAGRSGEGQGEQSMVQGGGVSAEHKSRGDPGAAAANQASLELSSNDHALVGTSSSLEATSTGGTRHLGMGRTPRYAAVLSCNTLVGMLAQLALQGIVGVHGLNLNLRS